MRKSKVGVFCGVAVAALLTLAATASAQRQMENLGRGVVAVNQGGGKAFVSWRMLGTEPDSIAFNVYRATGGAAPVKLNAEPITKSTCYQDTTVDLTKETVYTVKPILDGKEGAANKPFLNKIAVNAAVKQYFSIPLKPGLEPNDASVGDLDGDGEYEVVLKRDQNGRDNAQAGVTGEVHLEAYKLDGTFMWKINLGKNIRAGAHYTQFLVADFDGDGKAEVICKTADGTVDGAGKAIGDPTKNWVAGNGYILTGPEFLTVFEGQTGKALATTDYVPARGSVASWGDAYGNRVDRFLATVAYVDGVHPSAVMCRGYYTRSVLAAWDWQGGKLTQHWVFDSIAPGNGKDGKTNKSYEGQGAHYVCAADVDHDGKDEIVYGAACIDHDGQGLYNSGLGHGDAIHVSAFDPSTTDLQVFMVHERPSQTAGVELHDAATGKLMWGLPTTADTGRGLAADVDPRNPGAEFFAKGTHNLKGQTVQAQGGSNFAIWWDGDLGREILNSNQITKFNWEKGSMDRLFTAEGCTSNNSTKSTPCLSADIFGDWREEFIERTTDNKELRVFTTVIPTDYRIYTLMHDPQYRDHISSQNAAYNQPPWTGFFLGFDMKPAPKPNIVLVTPK